MLLVDYDAVSGDALYLGWAMPGTATSDAGWSILHPLFSGNLLVHKQWPNGSDDLVNVWDDRASLSYVTNDDFAPGPVVSLVPSGARPGHVFTVPIALTPRTHEALQNGIVLKLVDTSPGVNEYTIAAVGSVTTLTLGRFADGSEPVTDEDYLVVKVAL